MRVGRGKPLEGVARGAFDGLKSLPITRADERDADALSPRAPRAARAMHVRFRVLSATHATHGRLGLDHELHDHVEPTRRHVGSDEDAEAAGAEGCHDLFPRRLRDVAVEHLALDLEGF